MINQVKLSKYFQGYKYFNGRDNGRDTRKTLNLDKVDENKESITFFFEKGLVGMKKLFDKDIEYGIDTVLSEITPENLIHRLQGKWVYGKLC